MSQLKEELKQIKVGDVITVTGYQDSEGDTRNIEAEVLSADGYRNMLRRDLELLRQCDVADLFGDGLGDLQLTDLITARAQLMETKEAAQRRTAEGSSAGSPYRFITDCVAKMPENPDAYYVFRLKLLSGIPAAKPAKGAIPKAKQRVVAQLDLPSRRYVHVIKLEYGKFDKFSCQPC